MDKDLLLRIAEALERIAPPPPAKAELGASSSFIWRPHAGGLIPAPVRHAPPLDLILGVDAQKQALLANTMRFASGRLANNALLWGARGTGKSALIKAVHAHAAASCPNLKIVEAPREDLAALPLLLSALSGAAARVILFVDDLSFDADETLVKGLKPALEGGLAGRPDNLVVYATSNRRHLMARDPRENSATDLHWADTAEERLALADRFGLWLGFHALDQDQYLAIARAYAGRLGLSIGGEALDKAAIQWALTRGGRSGRVAWQFILDLAGRDGVEIAF